MEAWLKKPEIPKPLAFSYYLYIPSTETDFRIFNINEKKVNYLKDTTLE